MYTYLTMHDRLVIHPTTSSQDNVLKNVACPKFLKMLFCKIRLVRNDPLSSVTIYHSAIKVQYSTDRQV